MTATTLKRAWFRSLRTVLVSLVATLPVHSNAADTDFSQPLAELYEVALLMDAAVLDLNMLLGEEQSKAYSDRMQGTLAKLATAQKASTASLASSGISGHNTSNLASQIADLHPSCRPESRHSHANGRT